VPRQRGGWEEGGREGGREEGRGEEPAFSWIAMAGKK